MDRFSMFFVCSFLLLATACTKTTQVRPDRKPPLIQGQERKQARFIPPENTPAVQHHNRPLSVRFPQTLGGLSFAQSINYETRYPGMGVSWGFTAEGITATVYLYTARLPSIPDGPTNRMVVYAFKQALREIYGMQQLGRYQSVKIAEVKVFILGKGANQWSALCSLMSYHSQGEPLASVLCIRGHKSHFLKLRFTFRQSTPKLGLAAFARFANELGAMIASGQI